MICVSIGRGRHKHVIAEHKHLVEQGAQIVELRLDYITRDINLRRLISERPGPVLITCRRQEDGGKWARSEEIRQTMLRQAIAEGVEYVDLEEDIAGSIPRFGPTKRVISLHDFTKTPDDLSQLQARMSKLDADVVKIATMANAPHDNVRMLRLMADNEIPTVGMCMGEIGTPSRILAAKFGAPFTYATFHHERALAPGQLSFRQMTETYGYDQIDAETEVYGVIADPVGHSLSPIIHNAAFQAMNMKKVYVPFRIPQEHLQQFIKDAPSLGIKGLSVTIPHKESVISLCQKVDGAVRGIDAVNTMLFTDDGIIGFNTDIRAAMDSLNRAMVEAGSGEISSKTALVLGAGGAARAICVGLKRRGAKIVIAARTILRAQPLADQVEARLIEWEMRHAVNADIVINCTPLGMHPNVDETPFDKPYLRPSMIVFDTVYNPEQTLLIKEAREKRATTVTGVGMFVRQAALQYQYFTGQEAPMELMRDVLKKAIGPARRV